MSAYKYRKDRVWTPVPGKLDYISDDGLYAVYKHSYNRGLATYWIFDADLPARERKQRNALCVGGL